MTQRATRRHRATLADDARAAIRASYLGSLPAEVMAELSGAASRVDVAAGSIFHREGDTVAHLELVLAGVARIYVSAPDGRTMTIRYCRSGALIGAVSLFSSRFWLPATIQAVTDARLLVLPAARVRQAAERDVRVARVLLDELSERALSFLGEIPNAFATVRQRVARHLLDLASDRHTGQGLVAPIGQQELADAVGSVREVVVRVLRELREEGVVRTERRRIVLLEPERLAGEAAAAPVGAGAAGRWNLSR